jgi:beta-mannosidase
LATTLGPVEIPASASAVHFIKLELRDGAGGLVSSNFYWKGTEEKPDDLAELNKMEKVTLEAKVNRSFGEGQQVVTVTLHNATKSIALMTHLQLRDAMSGQRILPAYASDNYLSLTPDETRTVTITSAAGNSANDAQVVVDGWNVTVAPASAAGVSIGPNVEADPEHWPATGLPFQTVGLR